MCRLGGHTPWKYGPQGLAIESGIAKLIELPVVGMLRMTLPPHVSAMIDQADDPVCSQHCAAAVRRDASMCGDTTMCRCACAV